MQFGTAGTSGDLIADRRFNYARGLVAERDLIGAASLFEQALERAPEWAAAWFGLALARDQNGDRSGAIDAISRAAEFDRGHLLGAELVLAGFGVGAMPEQARAAYVSRLFDDYAHRFDDHLKNELRYRGPEILLGAIERVSPAGARFARVLDLGCGTGLMGQKIRDRSERLVGIDLSARMIEEARGKRCYDELTIADAARAVDAEALCACDLMIAADLLIYIGNLEPLFLAAHRALRRGGLMALTVQTPSGRAGAQADVAIGHDMRFTHSRSHLNELASAVGFETLWAEDAVVRQEAGLDVEGLVIVLGRP